MFTDLNKESLKVAKDKINMRKTETTFNNNAQSKIINTEGEILEGDEQN